MKKRLLMSVTTCLLLAVPTVSFASSEVAFGVTPTELSRPAYPTDMDPGSKWERIAVLDHELCQKALQHWGKLNDLLSAGYEITGDQRIGLAIVFSYYSSEAFARADHGNGVVVESLVPPDNCVYCGGGVRVMPR